jgi:hypothetical protein
VGRRAKLPDQRKDTVLVLLAPARSFGLTGLNCFSL